MRPLRSVLVPLDGSAFSEQALPLAVDIARRSGAALRLVRVHQPVALLATRADAPVVDPQLDLETRKAEEAWLEDRRARAAAGAGVEARAEMLDGPVGPALCERLAGDGADLVVMTTHGRGALSRLWLGSVADYVMRHASVPVIAMRPVENAEAAAGALRRFLIPLDRSRFSESVLEPATTLGRLFEAEYKLFAVVEPPVVITDPLAGAGVPLDGELARRMRAEAEEYLATVAMRLEKEGHRVEHAVVVAPGPARVILAEAESRGFDLIALATHGDTGIRRALLGSVADKVIRGSSRPILVFRPPP